MSKTFRRHSKIETDLPADLREEVNRLLLENTTYEDVALYCKAKGFDISRSSVGRYGKDFFEAYQNIRRFEDQSRALQSEVGDGMLLEEATTKLLLQKVMAALVDGSYDVLEIPRIISDVARLQVSSVQREKIKADFEKDLEKKKKAAVKNIEKKVKKHLDPETLRIIREEVYGIV